MDGPFKRVPDAPDRHSRESWDDHILLVASRSYTTLETMKLLVINLLVLGGRAVAMEDCKGPFDVWPCRHNVFDVPSAKKQEKQPAWTVEDLFYREEYKILSGKALHLNPCS